MDQNVRFTRRGILMLASGAGAASLGRLYARDPDFWNKKDPSQWSSEEIDRLTTKSPWAKEVTASMGQTGRSAGGMGGGGPMGGGRGGGGLGIPGIGGIGMPGGRGGMGGGGMGGGRDRGGMGGGGRPMQFQGVVRWESAQPILEALKAPLPEAFANRFVISVSGFPVLSQRRGRSEEGDDTEATVSRGSSEDVLERIKAMTYLEPKGKAQAQPGLVEQAPGGTGRSATLLFGFSKETLQLTPADKEVTFTTQLGNLQVKTKFDLKEMLYHNQLAL
jgi:hypothetical protein